LGLTTPTRSPSLNNLAKLYRAKGQYANAEPPLSAEAGNHGRLLAPEHGL
jgi:hypothetical protein